jgi:hypothetical protein
MKTLANLGIASLFLGSLLTGCAATPTPSGGDDDGGGGTGGNTGSDTGSNGAKAPDLDGTGTFAFVSSFDTATNMPGTVGTIVNDFIAATDDPDDPALWVVQQIGAQLPSSLQGAFLDALESTAGHYLNQELLSYVPQIGELVEIGSDFGDIAKHFGVNETYIISGGSGNYTATDTATGVHFTFGSVSEDFAFTDYDLDNIVMDGVPVQMDSTGKYTIGAHDLSLPYGKLLRIALDAGIIPLIDPSASSLNDFLADEVDCTSIGQDVSDWMDSNLGFTVGASALTGYCQTGLTLAANEIYSQLDSISSTALDFTLTQGIAKGVDTDGDGKVDEINNGKWTGTLTYSGAASAPLSTATFTATRL